MGAKVSYYSMVNSNAHQQLYSDHESILAVESLYVKTDYFNALDQLKEFRQSHRFYFWVHWL